MKLSRLGFALSLTTALSFVRAVVGSTEWEGRDDGLQRIGVVNARALTVEGITAFFEQTLRNSKSPPKVVIITAFGNLTDAQRYKSLPPPESTYAQRLQAYERVRSGGPLPMAQLVAAAGDIVVDTTDGVQIKHTVVRGSDPTLFHSGDCTFTLLDLSVRRLPRPIRANGLNPPVVDANVTADRLPSLPEAQDAAKWIQKLTGDTFVRLAIRTDAWFLGGDPLWYPTARESTPPPRSDSLNEIFCSADENGIRCWKKTFASR